MKRSSASAVLLLLIGSILPLTAQQAAAQSNVTGVAGVVRDPSGGAIPRSTIAIRHESSRLDQVIEGGQDGGFVVPRLTPGRYVVTVSAPGFASATRTIDVPAAEALSLTLSPAPIVEQVTVVSASRQEELRDTLNTRVDVITRSRIEEVAAARKPSARSCARCRAWSRGAGRRRPAPRASRFRGSIPVRSWCCIDGQPIVGARGIKRGGVLNLDRQSTARLERVEIVKGAASALYGSEALGGVINLITREPSSPFESTVGAIGRQFRMRSASRMDAGYKKAEDVRHFQR